MTSALTALATRLDLLGLNDLADLFRGALPHIDEIVDVLNDVGNDPVWKHGEALALPLVIDLIGDIDRLASEMRIFDVDVIHDETRQFSLLLSEAFQRNRDAEPAEYIFSTGRSFRIGYSSVKSLRFLRSHDEPLIQAADVLATALRAYTYMEGAEQFTGKRLSEWCSMILLEAAMTGRGASHIGGSDTFMGRIGKSVREGALAWQKSRSSTDGTLS